MKELIALQSVVIAKERQRPLDPGHAEEVASSFLQFGQLQPIILDHNNELIAGLHRLEAARLNGWTEIWFVRQDQVDELLAREIELEENIRRLDMTAAEKVQALAEINRLRKAKDPNWGLAQTAALVGGTTTKSRVSEAESLSKMIEMFPELKEAKSIKQLKSWASAKASSISRVVEVKNNQIDYAHLEEKIWLGDSVELIKRVPSESIHAVITDPPFGIDYDARKSGTSGSLTDYEDSAESYERLLSMAPDIFRVIKPNGWLIWFLGISWYERAKGVFRDSGFIVDEIPVIWDRSEGRCHTNRPDRYFGRGYDIALHCLKGEPEMVQRGKPNIIRVAPVETQERDALVERPVGLYAELIRRLTVPGEVVADFFVGSGSCPAAAAGLGRDFFGIEQNPERRAIALKKIRNHIPTETK